MTTKKKTRKEEKIAAEKAALRARLFDMLVGVSGGAQLEDDGEDDILVLPSIGLEELSKWMRAARLHLDFTRTEDWPQSWTDAELQERAFHRDNLQYFDTLNKAVEHLYTFGFRA